MDIVAEIKQLKEFRDEILARKPGAPNIGPGMIEPSQIRANDLNEISDFVRDVLYIQRGKETVGRLTTEVSGSVALHAEGGYRFEAQPAIAKIYRSAGGPQIQVVESSDLIVASNNAGNSTMLAMAGGDMQVYRRLSVGNQNTRYIHDANSRITFNGSIDTGSSIPFRQVGTSGGSGALPSPTKFITVNDSTTGTTYYIPVFTNLAPWTA